ncbi:amidase [Cohnella massiliensis]|uniref:amidase n=1 Tax=Cohnella massiliensis TaxID=1816691 RepID=UPI0009BB65A4|nr:amidase [Cohnella massiliensis]
MRELLFSGMEQLAEAYRAKRVSPVEVASALLARIEALNPALNAYITVMAEDALRRARLLEAELMRGELRGPLHGVPIGVKDNVQTAGVRTTAGSRVLADWIPDEDAAVVAKLKSAGAIIVGKTNLHEFAMGATTENDAYGTARNPWDAGAIAGGSSGGSGVAAATGIAFGAVGTDTAGSIRLPAAQCGIVGFKPTYGRVSRHGTVPFSWSLDHIGPMTRNVRDAAVMFDAMAGHDPRDPGSSAYREDGRAPAFGEDGLKGRRIGYCPDYFFDDVHPGMLRLVHQAMERIKLAGAELVEIRIPGLDAAQQALRRIAQAEGYAFHKPMYEARPELYGDDIRYRLQFGSEVTANQYLDAQRTRREFVNRTLRAMDGLDAIVAPMNHNPPFGVGTVTPERAINNMFNLAKAPLGNLLGFPAVTVPCGLLDDRLPVGIQWIGKPFEDRKLLNLARSFEEAPLWEARLRSNRSYEA